MIVGLFNPVKLLNLIQESTHISPSPQTPSSAVDCTCIAARLVVRSHDLNPATILHVDVICAEWCKKKTFYFTKTLCASRVHKMWLVLMFSDFFGLQANILALFCCVTDMDQRGLFLIGGTKTFRATIARIWVSQACKQWRDI